MKYPNYPEHCLFPDKEWDFFHKNHIDNWSHLLDSLKGKKNTIAIEVGSYSGGSAVWLLENILDKESSFLYCIDIEENDYLKNNLAPYKNVKFTKGQSFDVLRELKHNGSAKEFADFIYIDGSHVAKDVLEDIVLSWNMLKPNGIMILDDYLWGHESPPTGKPMPAVDSFLFIYQDLYDLLHIGWQVTVRKKHYELPDNSYYKSVASNDNIGK